MSACWMERAWVFLCPVTCPVPDSQHTLLPSTSHEAGEQANFCLMGSKEHEGEWSARVVRDNTKRSWGHKNIIRGTRLSLESLNLCHHLPALDARQSYLLWPNFNYPRYAMVPARYNIRDASFIQEWCYLDGHWLRPISTEQMHNWKFKDVWIDILWEFRYKRDFNVVNTSS